MKRPDPIKFESLTEDQLLKVADWMENTLHDMWFEETEIEANSGKDFIPAIRGVIEYLTGKPCSDGGRQYDPYEEEEE